MTLKVNTAPDTLTAVTFTFVVPGNEVWRLRSVRADATRFAGGAPDRAYSLTITDGTSVVLAVGAGDAGDEPGVCSITWTDADPSVTTAGADGVSVAPVAPLALTRGYVIIGTILNPAAGDTWADAVAWYDYQPHAPA